MVDQKQVFSRIRLPDIVDILHHRNDNKKIRIIKDLSKNSKTHIKH